MFFFQYFSSFPISKQRKLKVFTCINKRFCTLFRLWWGQRNPPGTTGTCIRALLSRSSGEMKFDSSSCMLKPIYFAFVKTMLEFFFLQTTHFVKSRANSPRPTSKIIAMIAFRRAILKKANPVVSLHAHRLFSGRACSCKKDPCLNTLPLSLPASMLASQRFTALIKCKFISFTGFSNIMEYIYFFHYS